MGAVQLTQQTYTTDAELRPRNLIKAHLQYLAFEVSHRGKIIVQKHSEDRNKQSELEKGSEDKQTVLTKSL